MLGRESFKEYDDMLFEALSPFYRDILKSKFHKYNRVYGNIEINTDKSNKCNMAFDEYCFDIINNSKRGLFVKNVKFTDLYYKKVRVSDIDRGKFDGIEEYIYSVVLMGFNLDEKYLDEKFKGGNRKRYLVDEGLFKDLSEKFEFKESILNEAENVIEDGIEDEQEVDSIKKERLKENQRKWDRGIFSKYEFFLREEDMDYLLKGIFEDKIEKERVRVWCDGEDMSNGEDENGNVDEGNDEDVNVGDMSEENVDKKVKRVKPYGFIRKIGLGLEEGCYWAGREEVGDIMSSGGYLLNERDVLRFDRERVPLGD